MEVKRRGERGGMQGGIQRRKNAPSLIPKVFWVSQDTQEDGCNQPGAGRTHR